MKSLLHNQRRALGLVLAILAAVLGLMPNAIAQFPGDIYFEDVVIQASPGDEIDVRILAFVGSETFGGARFTLVGDTDLLRTTAAVGIDTVRERRDVRWSSRPGRIDLVSFDREDAIEPSGSVVLATLRVLVDGAVGDMLSLVIEPGEMVTAGGDSPWNLGGFSLTVTVVDPGARGTLAGLPPLRATQWPTALHLQGVPVARMGHRVYLPWRRRFLETYDPRMARDVK